MTNLSSLKPNHQCALTVQALNAACDKTLGQFMISHGWTAIEFKFRARRDEKAEEHTLICTRVNRADLNGFYRAVTTKGEVIVFHTDSIHMEVA